MRTCKFCLKEKNLQEFVKYVSGYRFYCKKCHNEKYYQKKGRIIDRGSRYSTKSFQWIKEVKERDRYTCKHCGSTEKLHAHHIIPWKNNEELRFDINNGETLCSSCHLKHERETDRKFPISKSTQFKKGDTPKNKFTKGNIPWNKGIKLHPDQIHGRETQFKKGMISHNKGKKIIPHKNSVKTQFKKGISASEKTQFKKGMIPWNKELSNISK